MQRRVGVRLRPTIWNGLLALGRNDSAASFSSRNQRFAFIGNSLTDTDHSNLYTIVQSFQTSLGRNV